MGELILFLEERIADLTERLKEAEAAEDWIISNYIEGCIDAYDIVLIKLTKTP